MVIVLSNRDCLVYHWLYYRSYINMSMKVKELIEHLKKMPQTKEVYYSDNNQFLDIDNVTNQSDRLAPQGGLVILGFDMELRGDFIKRPKE